MGMKGKGQLLNIFKIIMYEVSQIIKETQNKTKRKWIISLVRMIKMLER